MAKGQQRSNREAKKPKKKAADKLKPGVSAFAQSSGSSGKPAARKS